jgi:hypothetical protein
MKRDVKMEGAGKDTMLQVVESAIPRHNNMLLFLATSIATELAHLLVHFFRSIVLPEWRIPREVVRSKRLLGMLTFGLDHRGDAGLLWQFRMWGGLMGYASKTDWGLDDPGILSVRRQGLDEPLQMDISMFNIPGLLSDTHRGNSCEY